MGVRRNRIIKAGNMNSHKKECKWYPMCPMKYFCEAGKLDAKWVQEYCHGNWEACVRYQMEERGEPHPDNMLPSGEIDENLI
jgi:hypothetical protein